MKVRTDIAELLRAGVPQIHICRQLHVAPLTVQRTREALGLPTKRVRVLPATLEEAFARGARTGADGHVTWAGPTSNGVPRVRFNDTVYYARRLAFLFHHGREPVGNVVTVCEVPGCMAGQHIEDRPMRERTDSLYTAIFGAPE